MNNNQNLYELLRQKRNEVAKEAGIKPYMVLQNSVLEEIAKTKPSRPEELTTIKGMGKRRIEKYGQILLEIVNDLSNKVVVKTKEENIFSVSEYLDYLNEVLTPMRAIIQGEVGRVDKRVGYTFFTLSDKDDKAVINCFVWQNKIENFGVELKEGMELQVEGHPKVYKRTGSFSFEVEHIGLIGEGALKLAFEKLKKKLELEGYFSPERKKPITDYVKNIGVITSTYADAKKDFLTHLGNFGYTIYFYDIRVEGIYAVDDIVSALRWFNESKLQLDVLVLTRGGGGFESLQAFNSESVAKAIFASKVPILTGIGHENDITIADLVADF
ncbi:MAG: exodeoxyribonuclease VII large subunit, partial [bacterium]|nr:exodeoxyribonuclease VII large subunit [bacterium]